LSVGFGLCNNPLGDDMIGVTLKSGFSARELLKMPLGAFRPTFLKTLTKRMMAL
jgi:hypothetical protein